MSTSMAHNSTQLSASQIADYFLFRASNDAKPITNQKLQKLLYYAQAWSLAGRDEKLFDEKIQAWIHGPAIPEIYLEYKQFGFEPIKKDVTEENVSQIPDDVKKFLDEIWTVYGKFDAAYLEQLTHSEEPWLKARAGLEAHVGSENEITLDSMRDFYRAKLETAKS
jgi:uncharacterized phage-associated protein